MEKKLVSISEKKKKRNISNGIDIDYNLQWVNWEQFTQQNVEEETEKGKQKAEKQYNLNFDLIYQEFFSLQKKKRPVNNINTKRLIFI